MRRVVTKHNKVAVAPAKAFVEIVREIGSSKESQTQYLPLDTLVAAPADGYVTPVYPTGANQALSGTGALADIDLNSALTTVDTTGVASSGLVAGTVAGLMKTIRMIGDLGDMSIAVLGDGIASIVLNDVGDECTIMWTGTGWQVNNNSGCVIT